MDDTKPTPPEQSPESEPKPVDGVTEKRASKVEEVVLNHRARREQERRKKQMQEAQQRMLRSPVTREEMMRFEFSVRQNYDYLAKNLNKMGHDLQITIFTLDHLLKEMDDAGRINLSAFRDWNTKEINRKFKEMQEQAAKEAVDRANKVNAEKAKAEGKEPPPPIPYPDPLPDEAAPPTPPVDPAPETPPVTPPEVPAPIPDVPSRNVPGSESEPAPVEAPKES